MNINNSFFTNKIVNIVIIALLNVIGYIVIENFNAVFYLIILSILIWLFSKNLTNVFGVPIILANLITLMPKQT